MPRADYFLDVVSGRRRGTGAAILRGLLAAGELPYAAAMSLRNRRYDRGPSTIHRTTVPVISIGNLTVGGTGKTPMVKWIARYMRTKDIRVSIVSRGYGAQRAGANDEALELEQAIPDVPHVQNPDRVAAAQLAVDELATQLVLLDDGFQHRRIYRDLDIVLLDATQPFGFGHLLPRGTLRESLRSLARADVICLTRCNLVDEPARKAIRSHANEYFEKAIWCEAAHVPVKLVNASGDELPLDALKGQKVLGFCGIGNPTAFTSTLNELGAQVSSMLTFPDHHDYSRDDIDQLSREASSLGVDWLVCTQKDLVKIGVDEIGSAKVIAVAIEMKFTVGQESLESKLDAIAERAENLA